MEAPVLFKCNRFGSIYINREGLECMTTLETKLGDRLWRWFVEAVVACSVERSFVEDSTFRGRPIITRCDVNRVIEFYQRLR